MKKKLLKMFLNDIKDKIEIGLNEVKPNLKDGCITKKNTPFHVNIDDIECFKQFEEAQNKINKFINDL